MLVCVGGRGSLQKLRPAITIHCMEAAPAGRNDQGEVAVRDVVSVNARLEVSVNARLEVSVNARLEVVH